MKYTANDSNVDKYIEELTTLISTIGTDVKTGTANLSLIIDFLQSNIDDVICRSQENLNFLTSRYNYVSALLVALEDSAKNKDNLEDRYLYHKSIQKSIKEFSEFMFVVNKHIDTSLDSYNKQISDCRRELNSLTLLVTTTQAQLTYLQEIKPQLVILKTKCSST
jgi:hypothetical protein